MNRIIGLLFLVLTASANLLGQPSFETAKPWTYWWWMGSAVNKVDIKAHLNQFSKAGLGGVHIIPIYGAKGYEDQFRDFLSEEWLEVVEYTYKEAEKIGLGVDMTLGTGWPYGGAWITPGNAAKKLVIRAFNLKKSDLIELDIQQIKADFSYLEVLAIYASNGKERINLNSAIKSEKIQYKVAKGNWNITLFGTALTEQMVKRAAPGGEGPVMDYFDEQSVKVYLNHFDSIFANTKYPVRTRAFYHDSYEVYNANWTGRFLEVFQDLHDYDLLEYMYILDEKNHENYPLILHDVRETLSELLYTGFTQTWTDWSRAQGKVSRNQAHGSPGNILDLYALADIPETESFGCSNFNIPGLDCDPDYEANKFGRPSPLMMKFASSPANLMSKPLVSSETATWLADHFKVALKRVKPQLDELFTAGINHVFYHGITYSPKDEGFPGWLFYASTNFGLQSHFWDEFHLLNNYATNCQQALQQAESDNDILLYFPINDLWTNYKGEKQDILLLLDVHHYDEWFTATSFGQTAELLWDQGYTFDYISDKQISQLKVDAENQAFLSDKSKYKTIVVPKVDYLPKATLEDLKNLARQGIKIIFEEGKPTYFSGFPQTKVDKSLLESANFIVSKALTAELDQLDISNEMLQGLGLDFIRKKNAQGHLYFITNLGDRFYEEEVSFSVDYKYLTIIDPLTNTKRYIETDDHFLLNLPPGKSLLIQTSMDQPDGEKYPFYQSMDTIAIESSWKVSFADYHTQKLKKEYSIDRLISWTEWGEEALKTYTGKATYTANFKLEDLDQAIQQYTLHIEEVRETAQVFINGVDCGTIWAFPNQLEIPAELLKQENQLEIVVQNLSANYMKKYDEENPGWKKFYDINFVNITYDDFSTRQWAYEPSGIIGKIYFSTQK